MNVRKSRRFLVIYVELMGEAWNPTAILIEQANVRSVRHSVRHPRITA
jgi:hypothetical protein